MDILGHGIYPNIRFSDIFIRIGFGTFDIFVPFLPWIVVKKQIWRKIVFSDFKFLGVHVKFHFFNHIINKFVKAIFDFFIFERTDMVFKDYQLIQNFHLGLFISRWCQNIQKTDAAVRISIIVFWVKPFFRFNIIQNSRRKIFISSRKFVDIIRIFQIIWSSIFACKTVISSFW